MMTAEEHKGLRSWWEANKDHRSRTSVQDIFKLLDSLDEMERETAKLLAENDAVNADLARMTTERDAKTAECVRLINLLGETAKERDALKQTADARALEAYDKEGK